MTSESLALSSMAQPAGTQSLTRPALWTRSVSNWVGPFGCAVTPPHAATARAMQRTVAICFMAHGCRCGHEVALAPHAHAHATRRNCDLVNALWGQLTGADGTVSPGRSHRSCTNCATFA